ncbi:FadR/GntR family transcriptional regulator [Nonlabens agnitus]|uniref:GntR family transcriptional regulator n=1 Tax=Nonlabens agnitus TaxID=870484 RepID=A0A2S9WXW2_9FLAO|nr:FadR/GntR family transcriptional regulator [Nonlabens agnitus]PRP68307.1 GntR family transcriptional regulator [Nonlabens agnitus]
MIHNRLKNITDVKLSSGDLDRDDNTFNEIKKLISDHRYEKGDKLPSQRKLSEKLGVGRNQIMTALQKLEFYGIVKTLPKSGTVVTGIQNPSVNMMMSDILELESPDFKSLVESRLILEENAVRLAAIRRTDKDLEELQELHGEFVERILSNEPALSEDFAFHKGLVKASNNNVIYSLMSIIVPDLIAHLNAEHICDRSEVSMLISEHTTILEMIENQDEEGAVKALKHHFRFLYQYIKK